MLKNKIELIRDEKPQVLLTWHKPDGQGGHVPIAIEYADTVPEDMRQRIADVCKRPINMFENGKSSKVFSGSSKHFLALPKHLARLGFRVRTF